MASTRLPDPAPPARASGTSAPGAFHVRAANLAKAFGPTQALRDASFVLAPREVHVLAGENGSGKSTLVKILSGVYVPDAGLIEWSDPARGATVRSIPTSPRAAQELGLATVFQEVRLAESRSLLENVWLGYDGLTRRRLPDAEKRRRAETVLTDLLGACPDLDVRAAEHSLSTRQACAIARALVWEPRILILDEATSSLDLDARARLIRILRRMTEAGAGVVFITHRLDEMTEIADRVTVMRSGVTVGTLERGRWAADQLVQLMSGSDNDTRAEVAARHPAEQRIGRTVLEVRDLVLKDGRRPFDLAIRRGELLGVAGLEGHGQSELLDGLRGKPPVAGRVVRTLDRAVTVRSTAHAGTLGIAFVPRERSRSIFPWMSIRENFGMPTLRQDSRHGWLDPERTRRRFERYGQQLDVVLGKPGDRITTLSGGNQQKVIVARWLAAAPEVLILDDPTRGIDIRTKQQLYATLADLADAGLAIVMASSDTAELVNLMDRVVVFREHELVRTLDAAELTAESLVAAYFAHEAVA